MSKTIELGNMDLSKEEKVLLIAQELSKDFAPAAASRVLFTAGTTFVHVEGKGKMTLLDFILYTFTIGEVNALAYANSVIGGENESNGS